jgi:hypothetical protein
LHAWAYVASWPCSQQAHVHVLAARSLVFLQRADGKKGRGGWELTGGERWSSATAGQGGDEVGLPRDGSATFPSPAAAPPDGSVLAAVSGRQQLWRHAPAVLGR